MQIDVWKKEIDEFERDLRHLLYPPCFCVLAKTISNTPKSLQLHLETSEGHVSDINMVLISSSTTQSATLIPGKFQP